MRAAKEIKKLTELSDSVTVLFSSLTGVFTAIASTSQEMKEQSGLTRKSIGTVDILSKEILSTAEEIHILSAEISNSQNDVRTISSTCNEQVSKLEEKIRDYRISVKKIGDILIEHGVIRENELRPALVYSRSLAFIRG